MKNTLRITSVNYNLVMIQLTECGVLWIIVLNFFILGFNDIFVYCFFNEINIGFNFQITNHVRPNLIF